MWHRVPCGSRGKQCQSVPTRDWEDDTVDGMGWQITKADQS